jgi:anti-sigma B factor antagonist
MDHANKFEINQEDNATGCTLYLRGELDLSKAEQFRSLVDPLAGDVDKTLTINLRDLRYIDSTGIGIFVYILKKRDKLSAQFSLEEIPPKIKRIFDITGISKFLVSDPEMNQTERTED